jgi:hypothetical protein
MGDIRCITNISMVQDPLMINVSCFQYDFFIGMQDTLFNEKQKPNFDTINNNSSNLYFIKGMLYSRKTFFITYLIEYFTRSSIKKIFLSFPTSATATRLGDLGSPYSY